MAITTEGLRQVLRPFVFFSVRKIEVKY